jgi:nickel-dependent lactate racemase
VQADFGARRLEIEIPDDAVVVEFQDPPFLPDPAAAIRRALAEPLGSPPLAELARPGMRVAIGFDNPTRPGLPCRTILPVVVNELMTAGVREEHIQLICANANHRKWTPAELAVHVGPELADRFSKRGQLVNHDASDPAGLRYLGTTDGGGYVEHSRAFVEADLMIYQGNISATYWGGYTGMGVVVGLGSARSIGSHHAHHVMAHPRSCTGNPTTSLYRHLKAEIHAHIEKTVGARIFYVNAVGGTGGRLAGVFAGHSPEVESSAWTLADTCSVYPVPQADVLIIGLPQRLPYEDPDNHLVAAVGALAPVRVWLNQPVLREGGVVIGLSPSAGRVDPSKYPAYQAVIDLYSQCHDVASLGQHEEAFCRNPGYLQQYTHGYGYHPLHAFWLFYQAEYALLRASRVFMVGTTNPGAFRALGVTPASDFREAWKLATRFVGERPTTVVAPSFYSRRLFKFDVQHGADP